MRHYSAVLAFATLVVSCGGSSSTGNPITTPVIPSTPTAPIVTTSVALQNSSFSPANIQVASNAVVTFSNNDAIAHNVTFSNGSIGTTGDYSSGSKTLTMPAAVGDYPFRCTLHAGMSGTVTVK
ncbi:MAG: plastocyanin/azurin family copper-binding protein [Gemmatimonadaceae bacterium]